MLLRFSSNHFAAIHASANFNPGFKLRFFEGRENQCKRAYVTFQINDDGRNLLENCFFYDGLPHNCLACSCNSTNKNMGYKVLNRQKEVTVGGEFPKQVFAFTQ